MKLHNCMLILSALQHSEGKYTMKFIHPTAYMPSESSGFCVLHHEHSSPCLWWTSRVSARFGKRVWLEVPDFQNLAIGNASSSTDFLLFTFMPTHAFPLLFTLTISGVGRRTT
ncbi:unnamed protein product [Pipistrellus nathusii]|uniref:Uncharacterized protein n=1 Tax=Pipistrellus nathusii TaxID=59473 RepID=A0ABP0A9E9_PIPNA